MSLSWKAIFFRERNSFAWLQNIQPGCEKTMTFFMSVSERLADASGAEISFVRPSVGAAACQLAIDDDGWNRMNA